MVILALVTGLVPGAAGVYLLRPALAERRARTEDGIELEWLWRGAEAELAAERAVVDDRLAAAIKTLPQTRLDINSACFSSSPTPGSRVMCVRSRTRSSASGPTASGCRANPPGGVRRSSASR